MKFVSELYGRHSGEDVYVVGSGASMRVFPLSLLKDKTTIGLNMAWKNVSVRYAITIHPRLNIPEFMEGEKDHPEITWVCGLNKAKNQLNARELEYAEENFYFFDYHGRPNTQPSDQPSDAGRILDWVRKPNERFLYLWSSISQAAVSLAANMGARHIILVGCDNCALADNHHAHAQHTRWKGVEPELRYHQYYEGLAEIRNVLRDRGVHVVSLNPFMGLGQIEEDFQRLCMELDQPQYITSHDISRRSITRRAMARFFKK